MLNPCWNKVLRDIWNNKAQTLLVVLSITVGVFAVATILGARVVVFRELDAGYQAINPAYATLTVSPFDVELLERIEDMPEVTEAGARFSTFARLKVGPDEWENMQLWVIPDFNYIGVNQITGGQVLLERSGIDLARAHEGDSIVIELADGKQHELNVVGLAHDITQFPTTISNLVYGYVSTDTMESLGLPPYFTELHLCLFGQSH